MKAYLLFFIVMITLLSCATQKDCKKRMSENKTCYYDNGEKKLKVQAKLTRLPFNSTLKGKVKSYKKKNNGKWKKYKTNLYVQSFGQQRDTTCVVIGEIGSFKGTKKRKKLKTKFNNWGGVILLNKEDVIVTGSAGNFDCSCLLK